MKLCIVGTGYVGLVSGACFSDLGNTVFCVDKDVNKINLLNEGIIPIYEPGLEELVKKNHKQKRLIFTNNIENAIKKSDIVFICVGTPVNKKNNSANLKYVYQVSKQISKYINRYKIIVIKSTVPFTTGDKIEKIIKKKNNKKLFDVVSNPEFLREGEAISDFVHPDRIVVGTNSKKANKMLKNLYESIIKRSGKYFKTSRRGAELIKYASNSFLATKISFINEIANLCEKAEVNVEDVSIGMGLDQRIGSRFLRPGPAYGGSCFPKDTKAIATIANNFKTNLSIVKAVIKSNDKRRNLLLDRVFEIMGNKINKKIITFLGVTFKPNTDDMREASSLKMIPLLIKKGAYIRYYDPSGIKKEFKKYKQAVFYKDISKACLKSDLIIIHTEWNEFKTINFKKVVKKNNIKIFDMRNIYSPNKMKKNNIKYFSIGR